MEMTDSAHLHTALAAAVPALQLLGERRQRLLRQQRRQVDLCQLESPCVRDTQTLTCCILSHCEAFVRHNMRAAQVGCVSALVAASSKVPTDD